MALFLVAYLGGVLTIVSPCILPVLPFVFARADRPFVRSGPYGESQSGWRFQLMASGPRIGWAAHPNTFLHIGETDCVAGVVGLELRCAQRNSISLTCRASWDSGDSAQTVAVAREDNLLC